MIRLAFLLLMLALSGCSPDASLGFGAVLAIGYGFWWLFMAGTIVVGIVAAVLGKDGLVQSCWDVWEASDSGASDGIDLFLRMLLFFAPLLFLVLALPAQSQTITDGDSLRQAGKVWRLRGIDAPELAQTCPDGWPAGRLAATQLQALAAGKTVICQERDRDRYGRTVATCWANGEDIGALMVRRGFAWAYVRYSADYVPQEDRAQAERLGVHAHGCVPAWDWRKERGHGRRG